MTEPLRILMVTGAYYPELSGGGLQCREIIRGLHGSAEFQVLSTSTDPACARDELVEGVAVHRILVDVTRGRSLARATWALGWALIRLRRRYRLIHLHGFSRKSVPVILLAKLLGVPVVLTLQTGGHDEPAAARAMGRLAFWCYTHADAISGVSPRLEAAYLAAGLPREKFSLIPNSVDVTRFRPGDADERRRLREALGLPPQLPILLFVGFFSREKAPDVAFEAWTRTQAKPGATLSALVFVGATRSRYAEVDPALVASIRERAQRLGLADRLVFVERADTIESYFRTADLYVLTSVREGLPIALLEAMATGLPCVATRLPGVTDTLIEPDLNGWLVPPRDPDALAEAIQRVLGDGEGATRIGRRARDTVASRYGSETVAQRYRHLYQALSAAP